MGDSRLKTIFIHLQFFLIFVCVSPAFSASITVIRAINFGDIIAAPSGDVIEIDARTGPDENPSVLTGGNTIVSGGYSGLVRVVSDMPGQIVNVTYPSSISLTADGFPAIVIDGMGSCSKTSEISTMAEDIIDIDIGGRLHIGSGFPGNAYYSDSITIDVSVINP